MYNIEFRDKAIKDYSVATAWYAERSYIAAQKFTIAVDKKLSYIKINPRLYKNDFKHFREVAIADYPYTIVYFIEEEEKNVVIMRIFHTKRDPNTKYLSD